MLPPAPVTSTARPRTTPRMDSSSSVTGSRRSRSSIATGRRRERFTRPPTISNSPGTIFTGMRWRSQVSTMRRISLPEADAIVMTACFAPFFAQ